MFNAGTELYRERFVRALAHELKVPLLVLDSSVLAPYVRYCIFAKHKGMLQPASLTFHLICRIMGRITQKVRRRMSMPNQRMKAQNLKWKTKVTKTGQVIMKNLVKVMMKMLLNLWKI